MKHFIPVLLVSFFTAALSAQTLKLAPDQPGCTDSKYFPKLLECRIDNCETKDTDRRDVPVAENESGDAVTTPLEGSSRSVMYECRVGMTPPVIIERAAGSLKTEGFVVPYRFADAEASITARKDNLWVLVESASRFYTVIEMTAAPPDFESAMDADSMAEMIDRYGHVSLSGVEFVPGRADLAPGSDPVLNEVVNLLRDHPALRLRVEGHTDNAGAKTANLNLSFFRAQAVVAALVAKGVKRARLDPQGLGDTKPVADNGTETGRSKNRRIELSKIAGTTSAAQ